MEYPFGYESELLCGFTGVLYFVAIDLKGGTKFTMHKARTAYRMEYGDAQCPKPPVFINGKLCFLSSPISSSIPIVSRANDESKERLIEISLYLPSSISSSTMAVVFQV